MSIPQDIIESIRERATISEFVSEVVPLKRSGRHLKGLCPFHHEKSPSFFVRDEEGTFHCFGCGKAGSVFDFVMATKSLNFPEAVRFVARRVGVEIPENTNLQKGEFDRVRRGRQQVTAVLREASLIYQRLLGEDNQTALKYLERRKVAPEQVRTFLIGYAPDRDGIERAVRDRLGRDKSELFKSDSELRRALVLAGLVTEKSENRSYDTFRGRLLFPITKSDGTVVAFGGRILADHPSRPKYINSPESPVYTKRRTFFGLAQGIDAIRRSKEVYLVEGYMDVVGMHQMGFANSLATCGTALTDEHVRLLRRLTERVTLVFDGDSAGVKAAVSSLKTFLNSQLDLAAVILDPQDDPGSLAERLSNREMAEVIKERRRPLVDVYLDSLVGEGEQTPARMGRLAEEAAQLFSKVVNKVEQEFLFRRAADKFGVAESVMRSLIGRGSPAPRSQNSTVQVSSEKKAPTKSARNPLSDYLRQLLVTVTVEPSLANEVLSIPSLFSQADMEESYVERIQSLLRELSGSAVAGIQALKVQCGNINDPTFQEGVSEFRELLLRFDLPGDEIVLEAVRQVSVGGSKPKAVVSDGSLVVTRYALSSQVERIKAEEGRESTEEERSRLVQEKLLAKRRIEALRNGRDKIEPS